MDGNCKEQQGEVMVREDLRNGPNNDCERVTQPDSKFVADHLLPFSYQSSFLTNQKYAIIVAFFHFSHYSLTILPMYCWVRVEMVGTREQGMARRGKTGTEVGNVHWEPEGKKHILSHANNQHCHCFLPSL